MGPFKMQGWKYKTGSAGTKTGVHGWKI